MIDFYDPDAKAQQKDFRIQLHQFGEPSTFSKSRLTVFMTLIYPFRLLVQRHMLNE